MMYHIVSGRELMFALFCFANYSYLRGTSEDHDRNQVVEFSNDVLSLVTLMFVNATSIYD